MSSYKVAMVAACPFPANYGSPGAIREMAETLASLGHSIHIVTYPFGEELEVKGVTISRCWSWSRRAKIYSGPSIEKLFLDFFLLIELCRIINREKIQIIHAHNYEGVLIGFIARLLTGRPMLYNATNLMSDELPLYEFLRPAVLARKFAALLDFLVARIPDGFIVITKELERALLERGVEAHRMMLIPCGVDLRMFAHPDPGPLLERFAIGDRPLVMYAGINSPIQRIDYLLRAFAMVKDRCRDSRLMVLSPLFKDDHLRKNRELAEELNLADDVIWVEGHRLAELPDYLAMAAVTVISRPDMPGQPIKLLNYMAARKPIVCFEGAAKGVHHLQEAFVARDHDWQELAGGIITLLTDRELAERLADHARQTVEREFDWMVLCRPVTDMYRNLLNHNPVKLEPTVAGEASLRGSAEPQS